MGSVERRLGDRSVNQDLQVLTVLMKVDYLTSNMLMIHLEI